MPAKTERQRRFMGAELARARAGKKTKTDMSEEQLEDFARKKKRKKDQHDGMNERLRGRRGYSGRD
jgi:hypothetical protein